VPEGHTLHRLARAHRRHYVGAPVAVSSPQGRFAAAAALVDGRVLQRAEALGKHLFHVYGPDLVVHVHLGLYGTFGDQPLPVQPPQGQVRMRLVGVTHWSDLRGPTACELVTDVEVDALRARLGPDPLRRDADPGRARVRVCRSRAPIAALLMDQSVLAGVGNVYRAEVLFRQRLDPRSPGRDLGAEGWDAVWADLVALMRDGLRRGRIATLRPEHRRRQAPGSREHYVYRRAGQPCLVCGTTVATAVLGGRKLYWCPYCQRPSGT
jgi:endonuclease-8